MSESPHVAPLVYFVDDDEEDLMLLEEVFQQGIPFCKVRVFSNGWVMLQIMREPGNDPQLIFLDLHMPQSDGLEVLTNLKINKQWAHIPVIVLTGSEDPEKLRIAYQLGAQSVINKPSSYQSMLDLVVAIRQYWFTTVRLPFPQA